MAYLSSEVPGITVPENLLKVLEPLPEVGGLSLTAISRAREATEQLAREYLEGVAARVREEGIPVEVVTIEGRPRQEILRFAEANQVDLIVLCTRGQSGLSRWLMGSVAEAVVRRAPCPVLTYKVKCEPVPEGEAAGEEQQLVDDLDALFGQPPDLQGGAGAARKRPSHQHVEPLRQRPEHDLLARRVGCLHENGFGVHGAQLGNIVEAGRAVKLSGERGRARQMSCGDTAYLDSPRREERPRSDASHGSCSDHRDSLLHGIPPRSTTRRDCIIPGAAPEQATGPAV